MLGSHALTQLAALDVIDAYFHGMACLEFGLHNCLVVLV